MTNEIETVSVTNVNRRLSLLVGSDKVLKDLYITGEISNYKLHTPSGHVYFTLKDERASIKCVMFKRYASGINFSPKDGMSVIVHGSVGVYEDTGANQVYATELFEEGSGYLYLNYLKVKEELEKGGYFSQKRKLPEVIRTVCIITSEKAAALQDMLNIIGERCPVVKVILIPAAVQGDTAPQSLISAIKRAQDTGADVIIIGRGGGSSEDLSAFNDKQLAIALFGSKIPTISAVGHETDFSITDMVADETVPTPSAAAVRVTPYTMDEMYQRLDNTVYTIKTVFSRLADGYSSKLESYERSVNALSPVNKLRFAENELALKERAVNNSVLRIIERCSSSLDKTANYISALNPMNILTRGYSIVKRGGKTVTSPDDVSVGDKLDITTKDGNFAARVIDE